MRPRRRTRRPIPDRLPRIDEEPCAPPPPELCARCDFWPAPPDGLLCRWCERVQQAMTPE